MHLSRAKLIRSSSDYFLIFTVVLNLYDSMPIPRCCFENTGLQHAMNRLLHLRQTASSCNIQKHHLCFYQAFSGENHKRALSINLQLICILLPPPLIIFTQGPKRTRTHARPSEKCLICLFRILNHRFSSITYANQF